MQLFIYRQVIELIGTSELDDYYKTEVLSTTDISITECTLSRVIAEWSNKE